MTSFLTAAFFHFLHNRITMARSMQGIEENMQILSRSILEAQGWKSLSELQEECRYRGIPDTGDKSALMNRLWTVHEQCWGPEGRKRDYERRLEVYRKKRWAEIVPFVWFNRFPKDIRLMVWEYSLPGPRTICPEHEPYRSSSAFQNANGALQRDDMGRKLYFPKSHHTPNPAALAVCRESRDIGLKRYRLCFASKNIYADLDIDILFFGPWQNLNWPSLRERNTVNWLGAFDDKELHLVVKADLDRVQRVGLKYHEGWINYYAEWMRGDKGFLRMRKDLSKFKGLKEVLLSVNREDGEDYSEPGQTILKCRGEEIRSELFRLSGGRPIWDPQYDPPDLYYKDREAILLSSWYKKETFTPEEQCRGVPEIKFVVVKRIPNVPPFKASRNMDD
jgi:hypothetical protein